MTQGLFVVPIFCKPKLFNQYPDKNGVVFSMRNHSVSLCEYVQIMHILNI